MCMQTLVAVHVPGCFVNILAYADVMAGYTIQTLIAILEKAASGIRPNMSVNLKKTVFIVFSPLNKRNVVSDYFFPTVGIIWLNLNI